jgi:hypothetical protein
MKNLLPVLALAFLLLSQNACFATLPDNADPVVPKTAIAEAKYDRLMRSYVNKFKLAFVQPEDAQTLNMLKQYSVAFTQQTEALKTELSVAIKEMPATEVKALYERLVIKSRRAEMMALLFDERITGRMQNNPEIRNLVETLHTKSLEIPNTDQLASK